MTYQSEHVSEHHDNNQTPLRKIYNLNMILDFVFDSMHLVYCGVVKTLCKVWINGNETFQKLSQNIINLVSENMEELVKYLPKKLFAQRPVGMSIKLLILKSKKFLTYSVQVFEYT